MATFFSELNDEQLSSQYLLFVRIVYHSNRMEIKKKDPEINPCERSLLSLNKGTKPNGRKDSFFSKWTFTGAKESAQKSHS